MNEAKKYSKQFKQKSPIPNIIKFSVWYPTDNYTYAKKRGNKTQNEKNQPTKIDPGVTQMIELVVKGF